MNLYFVTYIICAAVPVKVLICVRLFATPRTIAYQAPPSMEFSRQKYWTESPFPSPGDADALPSELPGKPIVQQLYFNFKKAYEGTSLVLWWLRLCTPNARGLSSIPGQGSRPLMPQLRVCLPQRKQKSL